MVKIKINPAKIPIVCGWFRIPWNPVPLTSYPDPAKWEKIDKPAIKKEIQKITLRNIFFWSVLKLWIDKKIAEAVNIKEVDFKRDRIGIELKTIEWRNKYTHNNNKLIVIVLFIDFDPANKKLAK